MDFTIRKYIELIVSLRKNGYSFLTFNQYLLNENLDKSKVVILRHDVDALPGNSLLFARIQNMYGLKGSYYFRAVEGSWDERIIKRIKNLGHEVGYHYESLTTSRGNLEHAISDFSYNLEKLRDLVDVSTICMHGSPTSKFDSRSLWSRYDYTDYGIIGEPYFDIDFNKVFYLTDTGRRWDGRKVSVRDKVRSSFNQSFHSTDEILMALENDNLPDHIMFTFHPQRWHSKIYVWYKELITQNIKNTIKRIIYVKK